LPRFFSRSADDDVFCLTFSQEVLTTPSTASLFLKKSWRR